MYCKKCGKKIPDGSKRCPSCGTSVSANQPAKQPISLFESAKKATKEVLIIGIFEAIGFVFNFVLLMIMVVPGTIAQEAIDALSLVYAFGVEAIGIAAFVLLIIVWKRWNAIKSHTGVDHKWFTVGYSVALGVEIILGAVFASIPVVKSASGAHIAIFCLMMCIDAFFVATSFVLSNKMKKTLHR